LSAASVSYPAPDPMIVVEVDASLGLAVCRAEDGSESSVEIALIESAAAGDRLLVHAGTALVALDPEEDEPE
jgi:hydrogenase maturation factor